MRNTESPYLADLMVVSLRWLTLFGLTISLGASGIMESNKSGLRLVILVFLALPALWNGFVSTLAIFNRRLAWQRQLSFGLDVTFGLALFIITGGLNEGLFWVGLLPMFSSAIYFGAVGVLVTALVMSVFQTGYLFLAGSGAFPVIPAGIVGGFNIVSGIIVASLSNPMLNRLRNTYQGTVNQRKESERKAQQMERDRMRALFAMIETFSSTLNYQTVMETVLGTAIAALGESSGENEEMVGGVLLFGDRQELEVRAVHGFVQRDSNVILPAEEGVLHEALKSGEAQILANPSQDPEMGKLITMQQRQSALCLPLIRGMSAYGVMLFAHPDPNFFTQERVETLQMLGNQAVIALQNAGLYQDLAREKERIVQSQEEAQKKLARDLHDGPTQSVAAIAMRINIARKMLEKSQNGAGPEAAKQAIVATNDELVKIEDLARRTTQEIRHMLFTLRPLVLESEGLEAALQTMADKMLELYQQNVKIEVDQDAACLLDNTRQSVIFYLSEEAVNNARKHAKANEIRVKVCFVPKQDAIVMLEILDNGVGFDVQSVLNSYDRRGSLGMVNLRERADQINGVLKIESVPNRGTRIRVFIPLNDEAADRLHQFRPA